MHPATNPARTSEDSPRAAPGRHPRGFSLHRLAAWLGLRPRARAKAAASPGRRPAFDPAPAIGRGDALLRACRQEAKIVTVLVFDLHDLPELECVFGSDAASAAMDRAASKLQRVAGRGGLVLRTAPTVLSALLPGTGREETLDLLHATFGDSCCLEVEAGGEEIVLVPEFATRVLRGEPTSLAELHATLCQEIHRARVREQQRREWLQRERESHSQPMGLQDPVAELLAVLEPRRLAADPYPRLPPTMAMPLGRR